MDYALPCGLGFSFLLAMAACGGGESQATSAGGSSSTSTQGTGGAPAGSGGSGHSGGAGPGSGGHGGSGHGGSGGGIGGSGGAGVDCGALASDLDAKVKLAMACNGCMGSDGCLNGPTVRDACGCTLGANSRNQMEVSDAKAAFQAYLDAGCPLVECLLCPTGNSWSCMGSAGSCDGSCGPN